jgi:hypothetical protein
MKPLPVALVLLASCVVPTRQIPVEAPAIRMERDVRFLASDEMKGRDNTSPEGAAAADYVARRMAEAGLRPGGENGTWFQTITGRRGDRGRNVIGALPGASGRWIVIGAHHDGLGVKRDQVYNGADDNASGVAVILEAARALRPARHGFLFCSFDAEEDGLIGSSHFVASGLYPAGSFVAMICLDLVGGTFLPGDERRIYALGSESSEMLYDWVGRAREEKGPLEIERVGVYAIEPYSSVFARSDYSAFRSKKVPFVFLSTGTPWYYHTPEDDIERLDFKKMEGAVGVVVRLAGACAASEQGPAWREPAPDFREDAQIMEAGCRRVLEHPAIRATDRLRARVAEAMETLAPEKSPGAKAVQNAMVLLFEVARSQRPAH